MLLAFTSRLKMGSAHLTLSPIHFTAQFDFAVSDKYLYEKIHTASMGTAEWADLGTRHRMKACACYMVTRAEMSPTPLGNDAACI